MEICTRAELSDRLGGKHALAAALASGAWTRVLRGAYVEGSPEITLALRARAAGHVLPEGAALSDRCLLWVLGVDVLAPGEQHVECVVDRGSVVPKRAEIRAREGLLLPGDVGVIQGTGVRALRPARAAVDLMRCASRPEALVVADAVLRSGLCTRELLAAELDRHRVLRYVETARWALRAADERAESPPESRVRALLLDAGLEPALQHEVVTPAGRFRLDLAFPELRIAIEYDGREVHDHASAFVSDRRRQNALVAAGWTVLRFTAEDLRARGRAALVAQVLGAVRSAQARRTA